MTRAVLENEQESQWFAGVKSLISILVFFLPPWPACRHMSEDKYATRNIKTIVNISICGDKKWSMSLGFFSNNLSPETAALSRAVSDALVFLNNSGRFICN